LALIGVINIPIIKYSVIWWNTLHQPATIKLTEKPAMQMEMFWPLLVMILAFYVFFALMLILRVRNEILLSEQKSKWVQSLVLGNSAHFNSVSESSDHVKKDLHND